MSYINANLVLPKELIKEIQKYVDGINLYWRSPPRMLFPAGEQRWKAPVSGWRKP